jgi:hypothetical protein
VFEHLEAGQIVETPVRKRQRFDAGHRKAQAGVAGRRLADLVWNEVHADNVEIWRKDVPMPGVAAGPAAGVEHVSLRRGREVQQGVEVIEDQAGIARLPIQHLIVGHRASTAVLSLARSP